MAKDPIIETYIAESKAKIEKMAPAKIATERHVDRMKRALGRSLALLQDVRDPLQFGTWRAEVDARTIEGAAAPRPARKAKAKRRR